MNPNRPDWNDYGGRGIRMFASWVNDFAAFRDWITENLGESNGRSLDRIDNDGNYEPGNLRWSTHSEQMKNRRGGADTKKIEKLVRERDDLAALVMRLLDITQGVL